MRERTALNRQRVPACRARTIALGAHVAAAAAEGGVVPHDDPESLAARAGRSSDGYSSQNRPTGFSSRLEEPVDHQH